MKRFLLSVAAVMVIGLCLSGAARADDRIYVPAYPAYYPAYPTYAAYPTFPAPAYGYTYPSVPQYNYGAYGTFGTFGNTFAPPLPTNAFQHNFGNIFANQGPSSANLNSGNTFGPLGR
jgi:hypothetical protein